jgi:hypothetical protein
MGRVSGSGSIASEVTGAGFGSTKIFMLPNNISIRFAKSNRIIRQQQGYFLASAAAEHPFGPSLSTPLHTKQAPDSVSVSATLKQAM